MCLCLFVLMFHYLSVVSHRLSTIRQIIYFVCCNVRRPPIYVNVPIILVHNTMCKYATITVAGTDDFILLLYCSHAIRYEFKNFCSIFIYLMTQYRIIVNNTYLLVLKNRPIHYHYVGHNKI